MRHTLALLLLLLTSAPPTLARTRAVGHHPPLHLPAIDAIAARALESGIPGLTIGIRKGTTYFVKGYGLHDRELGIRAGRHSIYQVGSITKQFAAAAVMRLVEEGKLSVNDRIRKWIPELDAAFDAITVEHLLTHSAGLIDYNTQLESAYEPKTQQEILALITKQPPTFTPGRYAEYSNSGYFVLGIVLERASGKPFDQLLRDFFFVPLSLHDTSYCGTNGPPPDGYYVDENNAVHPLPAAHMSLVFAAGAVCSSANDLMRWTELLASGAAVSRDSYARMTKRYKPVSTPPIPYGYGLALDPLEGRRRIWHGGDILGFQTYAARFPDEDLTVVVLLNLIDLDEHRATTIGDEVSTAMRPAP